MTYPTWMIAGALLSAYTHATCNMQHMCYRLRQLLVHDAWHMPTISLAHFYGMSKISEMLAIAQLK